ncbi:MULTISPECIES: type II toxin-antitoxin system VapB family antitoxin [unclassified Nocardioides]|uniref:type II toxin-antitoxin system VapB family antitoxin n=1 Tax=unclassified Nocardioides TaxID=2615069 RepID=UPI0006FDFCC5|nr:MULTISPECIES: type II toxin-antitoxin system VapB family antitoxin [unclassified Nocardioides]KRF12648.1 hypothetical protein ASH02_13945 [Nocardioides sp. Soil796]
MKTTIEIPDELAAEAKALSRTQRTTLRELIVAGLRAELQRRSESGPRVDFVFPTVKGEGLLAGITPADAIARSYDLPA